MVAPQGLLQAAVHPLGFIAAWRERRFAAACCRELLRLYQAAVLRHPGREGPELYRDVVTAHLNGDAVLAACVVEGAAESYSHWPAMRELRFRDVVHYLAVTGYCASARRDHLAMSIDVRPVIDAVIPYHL